MPQFKYVFFGLSVTSSWGNGHATTYRGLLSELARRGHGVLFLERDRDFYRQHRDLTGPLLFRTELYSTLEELYDRFAREVSEADLVVLGSYVPDAPSIADWVFDCGPGRTSFYDIDTPVTLRQLELGDVRYITADLIPRFDLYLSFTGGPTLRSLHEHHRARRVRPLYCSVDAAHYYPETAEERWDLGYLGTYSDDRQPALDQLLVRPARESSALRFVVAGAQYPSTLIWPGNVERMEHVAPLEHRRFYNEQRFTLNITRQEMVRAGHSPSVRLFEAAACGTPIISDDWPGLSDLFLPTREILLARRTADTLRYLSETSEDERRALGRHARARVLAEHTAAHRAETLEQYTVELFTTGARQAAASTSHRSQ